MSEINEYKALPDYVSKIIAVLKNTPPTFQIESNKSDDMPRELEVIQQEYSGQKLTDTFPKDSKLAEIPDWLQE